MTTGQMSMSAPVGAMQLVAAEATPTTTAAPAGDQNSAGGFSTILNGKSSAVKAEKPVKADGAEPKEAAVPASDQQIMAALAVAAQMSTTAAPVLTGRMPDISTTVAPTAGQNNDAVQNVPVTATADGGFSAQQATPAAAPVSVQSTASAVTTAEIAVTTPQQAVAAPVMAAAVPAGVSETAPLQQANTAAVDVSPIQQTQTVAPATQQQSQSMQTATPQTTAAPQPQQTGRMPEDAPQQNRGETVQDVPKAAVSPVASPATPRGDQTVAPLQPQPAAAQPLTEQVVGTTAEPAQKTAGKMPEIAPQPERPAIVVQQDVVVTSQPAAPSKPAPQDVTVSAVTPEATEQQTSSQTAAQTADQTDVQPVTAGLQKPLEQKAADAVTPAPPAEVEIALSQPRPITAAPLTAATAQRKETSAEVPVRNTTPPSTPLQTQPVDVKPVEVQQPVVAATLSAPQQTQQATQTQAAAAQPAQAENGRDQATTRSERVVLTPDTPATTQPAAVAVELPVAAVPDQPAVTASAAVEIRTAPVQQVVRGVAAHLGAQAVVETQQPRDIQTAVKATATVQQNAVPATEAAPSSDSSSLGKESDQAGSEQKANQQTIAQSQFAQLKADHQVSTAAKFSTEPLRQELSGQIAQQVREQVTKHDLKAGNQQISLTLSPENLGEVKMNLNLQGQKLTVEIVTENRTVRDAIMQHADSLKDSLAKQNITVESFDVTSNGRGGGNQNPGDTNQNAWRELAKQQQQQRFWTANSGLRTAPADMAGALPVEQPTGGRSMLDIHY